MSIEAITDAVFREVINRGRKVGNFAVTQVGEDEVRLDGTTSTYYIRQLVQQEAMKVAGAKFRIIDEIKVV